MKETTTSVLTSMVIHFIRFMRTYLHVLGYKYYLQWSSFRDRVHCCGHDECAPNATANKSILEGREWVAS
jgi:hypothetical protein